MVKKRPTKSVYLLLFCCFAILSKSVMAQTITTALQLDTTNKNQMKVEAKSSDEWEIETVGKDPFIITKALQKPHSKEASILSFEYFCPKGLDAFQIFFGLPADTKRMKLLHNVGVAEGWVGYTVNLSNELNDWGKIGDKLRLDFGTRADVKCLIRNIILRPMNEKEKILAANREKKIAQEFAIEVRLKNYLSRTYDSEIAQVTVTDETIAIKGHTANLKHIYLCEITPYEDVTEHISVDKKLSIATNDFEKIVTRFVKKDSILYDRLLSKWVLVVKKNSGYQLISHAHYPDSIIAKYSLPREVAVGKKGINGFSTNRGYTSDLDELNITSVTVNIWFTKFMFSKPATGRIEHVYNGKSYYFNQKNVAEFDSTFLATSRRGIVTAAILLVDKAEKCPDAEIGRLLQHPDMDPAGIYSMPNMTNAASVDCYAAALDFLASRYSRPDKKYGRLNHWIMHNEVDAGWEWTNMGEKTSSLFMDTYLKSMRMCYAIARKYNPFSEVFITLTHYWAWTSHPRFYPSKELMEILLQYTKAEGDFEWAMAQHPYPQSLFEPKTWLDSQVNYTFNSQLITFKNLEVLNAWIKLPEVLYKGKKKRTLWLSENGTNSRSYSKEDLDNQAAGFAYTWKKMQALDGIDGFQWHNWMDNRIEGGLRIGLRRFPDDETEPSGAKPVWYVFKAADAYNESDIFDPYKKIIGITDWNQVRYKSPIN
jgi:hypothetical protein